MRASRRVLSPLLLVGLLGCADRVPSVAPTASLSAALRPSAQATRPAVTASPSARESAVAVTIADAKRCPITKPTRGPKEISADAFFGWGSSFGNGQLWVGGLWPEGIIDADPGFVDRNGMVGMKFGWWHTAPGHLSITGVRLDATAPPALGDVPDGYGNTGFQASGVTFPTEGCWAITGWLPSTSLTFVTFVIKVAA